MDAVTVNDAFAVSISASLCGGSGFTFHLLKMGGPWLKGATNHFKTIVSYP